MNELQQAIFTGKLPVAIELTNKYIAEGVDPQQIIHQAMIPAMEEVGARFEAGKAFVPELLMAARAMKGALDIIKPLLVGSAAQRVGKVVIGTVKGDLHDIGKNLVASMLEGCGFEVINLGADVSSERFVEAVREHQPDILCLSALLTTTMTYMKTVIEALREAGLSVPVMVGGAPVNRNFAESIGANGYSENANSAVVLAKSLVAA